MLRTITTALLLSTLGPEVTAQSLLGGLLGGSGAAPTPSPSPAAAGAVQAGGTGSTSTTGSCTAFPFNPWLLNVAVLGDLGTTVSARSGTIKGSVAVLGNAYASSFNVNTGHSHSPSSVALYVGGGLSYTGGQSASGGLEVAGNVALNGVSVVGDVTVGGSLTGSGSSSITGNLLVAGSCALCQTLTGLVSGLVKAVTGTFSASLSLGRLLSYFNCISLSLAVNVNTATYALAGTQLTISLNAQATRNYVTVPAAMLANATTVSIVGTAGLNQELVINVPDVSINLANAITFNYGNVNSSKVLLNLPNAASLTISGGFAVNLLAPFATTSFSTGVVTGNVIVKSLLGGSGQINDDIFLGISLPLTCPGEACAGSPVAAVSPAPTGCASLPFNPWLLNLAVLGDLGSTASALTVSVKGAAAVLGSAWAASLNVNVGLHARCNSATNLYVGGSLTCNGGQSSNGGIEVAGNVFLNGVTISGNVAVGGVLNGGSSGASIAGSVTVGGTCPLCTSLLGLLTGGLKLSIGAPFTPSLNLNRVQSYFQCIASWVHASADTATYALSGTQLTVTLNAQYARHFVTISASALASALTVTINGTAGLNQELIINVPDVNVTLTNPVAFTYVNINSTNVLLNLPNAVTLAVGGSIAVNLLAPLANVTIAANVGLLSGTFIVKALLGASATFSDDVFCNIAFPSTCPYEACAASVPAVVSPPPPAGCPTLPFNPWLLNAVVLGDVGSAATTLGTTAIKGAAAVVGNVWATGLSLNVGLRARAAAAIDLYVGGSLALNGGSSYAGGLEVAGNVALSGGVSVNGNVAIGGILNGGTGGASIAGNLNVAVACPLCSSLLGLLTGGFQQNIGTPFTPTLNLNRVQSYFQCTSSWAGGSSDTVAYTTSGSTLTINLGTQPIRHFVTISAAVLGVSLNVVINGGGLALGQELIINVPDVSVNLTAAIAFNYVNINSTKVLLNLPNAVSLAIGTGFTVNLLAPLAATLLNGGVTAGTLIVKQLLGSGGKINDDTYCGIAFPSVCPNEACASGATVASSSSGTLPSSPAPSPVGPPASPAPVGTTTTGCAATLAPYTAQYSYFDTAGCNAAFVQSVALKYGCTLLDSCNAYFCSIPIPPVLYGTLAQCILA